LMHLAACLDIKRRAYRLLEQIASFIPIDFVQSQEEMVEKMSSK
jgi:hypothetical protein